MKKRSFKIISLSSNFSKYIQLIVLHWLIDWLIDKIVFYAVPAIFRPYNGGYCIVYGSNAYILVKKLWTKIKILKFHQNVHKNITKLNNTPSQRISLYNNFSTFFHIISSHKSTFVQILSTLKKFEFFCKINLYPFLILL